MRITYLFDPLCGWCYGAGPAVERLSHLAGVSVRFAPTGLFAGENARPMDAAFATFAWENDQRIARLTGQPFSQAYRDQVLGASDAMFDSAPATLGIVAVGASDLNGERDALKALQRARYVEGRDIADPATVADVLAGAGFAAAARRVETPDAELRAAYQARIDAARPDMARVGARGVPALVVEDANGGHLVPSNIVFGDPETLASHIQAA